MIPLRLDRAARVLGGELVAVPDPGAVITQVTADSRQAGPGSLFVALPGERVDGRDFAAAAREAGAVAVLTGTAVPGVPCLVAGDPLAALGRLARHVVELGAAGGLRVVGITGSVGKTSTKDLLAQVLPAAGETVAPAGNLNNELGLPLTATRVEPATRFLVAEMGARGVGHIAYLCRIVPPRIGVVLNVGHAHVGEFGGQKAIAAAKSELPAALPEDGVAVLNVDDPRVWGMRSVTRARVLAFSAAAEPDQPYAVWAGAVTVDDLGRPAFALHVRTPEAEQSHPVRLRLSGAHQVVNAVAAAGAAVALGLPPAGVAAALSGAGPRSRWRMELAERGDGLVVINDAYNANPESMRAAVDTLADLGRRRRPAHPAGRTWALLGDMLELGDRAVEHHRALGRRVAEAGIDRLVAVGSYAGELAAGARSAGLAEAVTAVDKAAMSAAVRADLRPGDVVLVKASRGLALDTVAEEILTADPGHPDHPGAADGRS